MNANQPPQRQRVTWKQLCRPFLVGAATGIGILAVELAVFWYLPARYRPVAVVLWVPVLFLPPRVRRWSGCPATPSVSEISAYGSAGFIGAILALAGAFAVFWSFVK